MLSPADVAQFKRDGYFIQRKVFQGQVLERLRASARQVQDYTRQHLPEGTRYWFGGQENKAIIPAEQRPWATWGVNEITRKSLFDPELVNVFAHPVVHQAMHALLDQPRAWGIKILWTPKVVSYNLGWHRDQMGHDAYDYIMYKPEAQDHVQFNAALNDDPCFIVVPGSHRRKLTAEEWHALRTDKTAVLPGQVEAAIGPGDILYMDAHTLHRGMSSTEGDRLTLHYSCQSQWVPLQPWGKAEDFEFITSDEFMNQLHPDARPYYERLRTAERTDDAMAFAFEAAKAHGYIRPAVKAARANAG